MTEELLQEMHKICTQYARVDYPMTANIAADCALELLEEVRRLHAVIRHHDQEWMAGSVL